MAWMQHLADRRLSQDERIRYHAFRREIAESWHPTTEGDRLLELRARAVHACTRLFAGGPTMLQVALPALITAIGFALRAVGPGANDPAYSSGGPRWVLVVLAAMLGGMAIEMVRSPRHVHEVRFVLLIALPLGIAALARATLMRSTSWLHLPVRLATLVLGAALLLTLVAARTGRRRLFRLSLALEVLGAIALVLGEATRGAFYVSDGDTLLACASACIALGVSLLAVTLFRSHPERWIVPDNVVEIPTARGTDLDEQRSATG